MSGPYSADLYIAHSGLSVAENSEEAAWLHISSPFSMSHILRFSTGHVKKPTLLVSNTTVTDNKDAVVLTCYTNAFTIQWLFNGRNLQLSERRRLSEDRRSLTIDPVQKEDTGYYQCRVSNPVSCAESWDLELNVKSK